MLKAGATNSALTNVATFEVTQFIRKPWSVPAKINKVFAHQHSIDASVACDVPWVRRSIGFGVEGIALIPSIIGSVSIVDVVAATLFATAVSIWFFLVETLVNIVVAKAQDVGDTHCVNKMSSTLDCAVVAAASYYPIVYGRRPSDVGLTCGKRAESVEWVWREAAVVADDIRVQSHFRGSARMPLKRHRPA